MLKICLCILTCNKTGVIRDVSTTLFSPGWILPVLDGEWKRSWNIFSQIHTKPK